MPETMRIGCDGIEKWHWWQVQADLVEQGNLNDNDTFIDPLLMKDHSGGGCYNNQKFVFTWVKDKFFLLTMAEYSQDLVDAFSKVIEYTPFCRYELNGLHTVEWDKIDQRARELDLATIGEITNFSLL